MLVIVLPQLLPMLILALLLQVEIPRILCTTNNLNPLGDSAGNNDVYDMPLVFFL